MSSEEKDQKLWKRAEARVGFKRHLATYLTINVFLWVLWASTGYHRVDFEQGYIPWPFWVTVGWGVGLFFNYLGAYRDGVTDVEKEYQKLKDQAKKH